MVVIIFVAILFLFGCEGKHTKQIRLTPHVIKAPPLGESISIKEAQQLVKLFPKSGYAHYLLGCAYYERREFAKAIPAFEQALQLDPAIIGAYYGLAYSYTMLEKWVQAKAIWKSLLNTSFLKKDRYNAYMGLGNVSLDQHTKTLKSHFLLEAEKFYQKAIQIDPKRCDAFYGLGIVAARSKQWDRAKELFKKAFSLSSTPRDRAKSLEALANVWLEKGDWKHAKRLIQKAKEIDPSYPATLFAR